jgi:hypothetical protein
MALDPMAQELVNETMTALQSAPFTKDTEVLINPRRMRALILYSQQRMQVQFNNKRITLVEDNDAPELASAIEAATQVQELPEPVLPPLEAPRGTQAPKTLGQHKSQNGKNGRKYAR